jgi:putative membrane protein
MAGAPPTEQMPDPHQTRMASLASERTWLAWWRTALAASAGALGVGRLAPEVLGVAPWPYIVLGGGYALVAVAMLAAGLRRQRQLERALQRSGQCRCALPSSPRSASPASRSQSSPWSSSSPRPETGAPAAAG